VLIEKEFVSFGHQFSFRSACAKKKAIEKRKFSPILIQFLDCVYQVMNQFQTLFEFNSKLLVDIAFHYFSLRFGTFIGNSEKQRKELKVKEQTISLWTFINYNKEKYLNPFYKPERTEFYPETTLIKMKLWEELYVKWPTIAQQ